MIADLEDPELDSNTLLYSSSRAVEMSRTPSLRGRRLDSPVPVYERLRLGR